MTTEYPICDGFLYNTQLKPDLRFLPLALQQYEALRRTRAYAQRIVTIPEDPGFTVIPARNVFRYGVRIKPGSAFWGWSFVATAGSFSVNLRDNCSDETIFSEVVLASGTVSKQRPFSKLLVIGAPGLVNCEICSLSATDTAGVQFLLWGGEPKF